MNKSERIKNIKMSIKTKVFKKRYPGALFDSNYQVESES